MMLLLNLGSSLCLFSILVRVSSLQHYTAGISSHEPRNETLSLLGSVLMCKSKLSVRVLLSQHGEVRDQNFVHLPVITSQKVKIVLALWVAIVYPIIICPYF